MARSSAVQMALPWFELPAERRPVRVNTMNHHSDELEKAQLALERMKEKKRIRSLKMELALAESEQQTDVLLEQQRQAHERADRDPKLEELLRLRKAGVSIQEALSRIEGDRKPAKAVNNRSND
jgi:predicted transcriptional regulator